MHWLNFSDLHVTSTFYTIYRPKTKVGFLLVFVVLTPFETMSLIYLTANMTFCVMQMFMRQFCSIVVLALVSEQLCLYVTFSEFIDEAS